MLDYIEIKFWQVAKWVIRKGYGAYGCDTYCKDCSACEAGDVMRWIDKHISLIKM